VRRRTKKPGPPLTARGARTRRKLLAAAEREFGERGFHEASVSSITRRAKVAQGSFYTYFASKDDCFSALVESVGRDLRRQLAVAAGRAPHRLAAERAGLEAFLAFVERHPHLYRIVEESQFVDPQAHRAYYERIAEGYAAALEAAAARGELAPGDGQVRAWALMGIGHFLGLRYGLWRGRRPDAKTLDEVMRFVERGMGPRAR